MNVITCRQNSVGRVVAEVAESMNVPCSVCDGNCPQDHSQDADGILFLTNHIGPRTMREVGEPQKPCLVVAVPWDQQGEFARKWIRRKGIEKLFISGNASTKTLRQFIVAFLGGESPPEPRRPSGFLARVFRRGWHCRALEFE